MWQIGEIQNDLKLVKLEKTKQILYNSVAQMLDAIGLKIDLLEDSPIGESSNKYKQATGRDSCSAGQGLSDYRRRIGKA